MRPLRAAPGVRRPRPRLTVVTGRVKVAKARMAPGSGRCPGCKAMVMNESMSTIEQGGRKPTIRRCPACVWKLIRRECLIPTSGSVVPPEGEQEELF